MPVRFSGSGHVFAGEPAADDGVIVVLDASTTKLDVVKARSIAGNPNVPASLKFRVDNKTAQMLVHFQP